MVNVALIGCGYWGKNYVKTINEIEGMNIKWIYNKQKDILKKNIPKGTKFTKDYKKILSDNKTDAVIIATPPKTHYKIVKQALEAGKDVLVEKPMTYKSEDAIKLADLADKESNILMVGHTFLYNPAIVELKKKIDRKELGKVLYFNSRRTSRGPIRQDIGVMWDQAIHDISIINYIGGIIPKIVSVKGKCFLTKNIEDVVSLTLEYNNGIKGFVYASWFEPKKIRETTVIGDKKVAIFDDTLEEKLKIFGRDNIKEVNSPKLEDISPLENQCLHFLKSIKTRERPLTTGYNGYEIVKILECAQKSLETNREMKIKY